MISLNNDTKNKIYLNVKKLKNLISLFSDRIDEIFTMIKLIVAKFIFFENCVEEYVKTAKLARETTKKAIKATRQVIRKKTNFHII